MSAESQYPIVTTIRTEAGSYYRMTWANDKFIPFQMVSGTRHVLSFSGGDITFQTIK